MTDRQRRNDPLPGRLRPEDQFVSTVNVSLEQHARNQRKNSSNNIIIRRFQMHRHRSAVQHDHDVLGRKTVLACKNAHSVSQYLPEAHQKTTH